MKKRGRKALVPGEQQHRRSVTFDDMTLRRLAVLGGGNISRGVRLATQVAWDKYQRDDPLPEVR